MKITPLQYDKITLLDQTNFEKLRNEKLRPQYNIDGLKLLKLQSIRERDLRELYRDRAPYELLQNADDAGATNAVFVLSDEGMAFAHNGRWFTVDNFRSLAEGWSDKNPNECIGHKGLGFRSVLDITPAPHILKVDPQEYFAVKFNYALNSGHIEKTLQDVPSLQGDKLVGKDYCPVMSIPGLAKKKSLGDALIILNRLRNNNYEGSYSTMFWFPNKDPEIQSSVLKELGPVPISTGQAGETRLLSFLEKEVSIFLPFLKSIHKVKVYSGTNCIGSIAISKQDGTQIKDGELEVLTEFLGQKKSSSFFQMTYFFQIPREIKLRPDTPKAIKEMDQVGITISVKLEDGQPEYYDNSFFHVYFPTQELTGGGFVIHGDFFVKPDRTRLMTGDYNEWLLKKAAEKAANEFLTQVLERYDSGPVFKAMSPSSHQAADAAKFFYSSFAAELKKRKNPFIQTRLGLLNQAEAILPPSIDEEGFWDEHFHGVVNQV